MDPELKERLIIRGALGLLTSLVIGGGGFIVGSSAFAEAWTQHFEWIYAIRTFIGIMAAAAVITFIGEAEGKKRTSRLWLFVAVFTLCMTMFVGLMGGEG